jgi:hypothetical protein
LPPMNWRPPHDLRRPLPSRPGCGAASAPSRSRTGSAPGAGVPERDGAHRRQPQRCRHFQNFALIGPGDIIGVNPHLVVRTEPRNWISISSRTTSRSSILRRISSGGTRRRASGEKLALVVALVLEAPDNASRVCG